MANAKHYGKSIYFLLEEDFISKDIVEENYPKRDFHDMYIGEILKVYVKEDDKE